MFVAYMRTFWKFYKCPVMQKLWQKKELFGTENLKK